MDELKLLVENALQLAIKLHDENVEVYKIKNKNRALNNSVHSIKNLFHIASQLQNAKNDLEVIKYETEE